MLNALHAYIVLQKLDLKIKCRARDVAHLVEQLLLRPVSLGSLPSVCNTVSTGSFFRVLMF